MDFCDGKLLFQKIINFINLRYFIIVYNASLFGNCLQGLEIKDLLILQRSLEGLSEISSTLNSSNSKVAAFTEECPPNLAEKCPQPKAMALVDEKAR